MDAPYPELVKRVPHVAFEVDSLEEALRNQKKIIKPKSPSKGLMVALIETNGAPMELVEFKKETSKYKIN